MNSKTLVILSCSVAVLAFTACKKEEPAAATTPPAPSPTAAAADQLPSPTTASNIVANAPSPAAISNAAPSAEAAVWSPTDAKAHVGEEGTVKGKVFGVHTTAKGDTFINVGAAYPDAPFAVVHFHSDETITTNDLAALDGKTLLFSGKLKDHNGQPEIVITKADQVKNEDGSPAITASGAPAADAPKADDRAN